MVGRCGLDYLIDAISCMSDFGTKILSFKYCHYSAAMVPTIIHHCLDILCCRLQEPSNFVMELHGEVILGEKCYFGYIVNIQQLWCLNASDLAPVWSVVLPSAYRLLFYGNSCTSEFWNKISVLEIF